MIHSSILLIGRFDYMTVITEDLAEGIVDCLRVSEIVRS